MDEQPSSNPVTPPVVTESSPQVILPDVAPQQVQSLPQPELTPIQIQPSLNSPTPPVPLAPPTHLEPLVDPATAAQDRNQKIKRLAITSGSVALAVCIVLGATVYAKQRNNHQQQVATQKRSAQITKDVSTSKPLESDTIAAPTAAAQAATAAAAATTAKTSASAAKSTAAPAAAAPATAAQSKIQSKCFTITLPKPNDVIGDSNDCNASGSFNSNGYFDVTPVTQSFLTLGQAVFFAKQAYGITSISERGFSLSGQEAFEIVYNFGSAEDPPITRTSKILVVAKDKGYTNGQGDKITGFEINMTSDTAANKKALDTLLSTWSWR